MVSGADIPGMRFLTASFSSDSECREKKIPPVSDFADKAEFSSFQLCHLVVIRLLNKQRSARPTAERTDVSH